MHPLDRCKLQKFEGVCGAQIGMYYYDQSRDACDFFYYSGCMGNNNRFETYEECRQTCVQGHSIGKNY